MMDRRQLLHRMHEANNRGGLVEAVPGQLANLVAWGEASDIAGTDGTAVSSWTNRTNSGIDPAQATGSKQPVIRTSAINGQRALDFTAASSQDMTFPAGALGWAQNRAGLTFLAVCQLKTVAATAAVLHATVNASASSRASMQITSTPTFRLAATPDDVTTATAVSALTTPTTGTPFLLVCTFDFVNGALSQYVNGRLDGTASCAAANTANTASQAVALGSTSASSYLNGYVGAYAIWTAAYTRQQLDPVLRRFARIYGVTLVG